MGSAQLVRSRSGIFVRQACSPNTNGHISILTFECELRSRHEPFLSVFHCVRDRHLLRRFWRGKSFNFLRCWIEHCLAEITARTKTLINFLRGRRKTHSDPNSAWLHSWDIHIVFSARRLIVEITSHLSHCVGWSTLAAVRVFRNFLIRARYVKPFFFRRNFSTRAFCTTKFEGFVSVIMIWTRGVFLNRRSFIGRDFCSRASLTKGFARVITIRTRIYRWSTRPIHVHCIWFVYITIAHAGCLHGFLFLILSIAIGLRAVFLYLIKLRLILCWGLSNGSVWSFLKFYFLVNLKVYI